MPHAKRRRRIDRKPAPYVKPGNHYHTEARPLPIIKQMAGSVNCPTGAEKELYYERNRNALSIRNRCQQPNNDARRGQRVHQIPMAIYLAIMDGNREKQSTGERNLYLPYMRPWEKRGRRKRKPKIKRPKQYNLLHVFFFRGYHPNVDE